MSSSTVMNIRFHYVRTAFLGLLLAAIPFTAQAQMFGERDLGSPLSKRPKPGMSVGAVTGNERYVRGNRDATDFVGSDSRDPSTFVGAAQGTTTGRVPTAVEGLRRRRVNEAQLNPPLQPRRPRQIAPPRIELGFTAPVRPLTATLSRISQSLQTPDGRFERVEVQVTGGTATMRGTVDSSADRSLAEALVQLEPAITDVQNELIVHPENGLPVRDEPPYRPR